MTTDRLPEERVSAFYATRDIAHQPFRSGCYAPFVGLSFDIAGWVSVCAPTRTTPLGRIGSAPLISMWRGETAERLRGALRADDFLTACSICADSIRAGNPHGAFARSFDRFTVDPEGWPQRLEFSLSNECNLRCIMCSGEFSSSIRSRTEGLPVIRSVYGDAFLDELEPFLDHAAQARFLGGEPFLNPLNHRIWDHMMRGAGSVECNITTNGTIWNQRIERLLDQLHVSIGISVDGISERTVERIRSGADYEDLMANIGRFLRARATTRTSVSLTYCLMRPNWHEFASFLAFADEHDCDVYVNTVNHPAHLSLYRLRSAELTAIVERMAEDPRAADLGRNRLVWSEALTRLRHHADDPGADEQASAQPGWERLVETIWSRRGADESTASLVRASAAPVEVSTVVCDENQTIVSAEQHLGLEPGELVGRHLSELSVHAARTFGHRARLVAERAGGGTVIRLVSYADHDTDAVYVLTVTRRRPASGIERTTAVLGTAAAALGSAVTIGRDPR